LPHTNVAVSFAPVGDEGFLLKTYLMRPYARRNLVDNQQHVFNYRISRARRIIGNTFGILVARWQIFQGSIFKLETAEVIVQAACCLHNFIINTNYSSNRYIQEDFVDREGPNGELIEGSWRSLTLQHSVLNRMGRIGANIGSIAAMKQRDSLAQYFVSDEGSIPWQWEMI